MFNVKMKLSVGLALILIGGCAAMIPDYAVSIRSLAKETITEANVVYGTFSSGGGVISPGVYKGYGHVPYPIPDTATVEWRTQDKVFHRTDVNLKNIPKNFNGEIRFEIDNNNSVTVQTFLQKKRGHGRTLDK
jgi:hypothetical protein